MNKANQDIRTAIYQSGFPQWKVAKQYGLSDSRFCVILRMELEESKKIAILKAIKELKEQ